MLLGGHGYEWGTLNNIRAVSSTFYSTGPVRITININKKTDGGYRHTGFALCRAGLETGPPAP